MEIIELNSEEFKNIFQIPYFIYGTSEFNLLNKDKVDEILFLGFKDKKYRLGIIMGYKNNTLLSPFSAPFGSFVYIKKDIRINYIDTAIEKLKNYSKSKNIDEISITLPPYLYNDSFISKQINCFFRANFKIKNIELNYHFDLNKFDSNYIDNIWYNARKNLKISLKNELTFHICDKLPEKKQAYEIIKINRKTKGYPLRLNWEQIEETIKVVPANFFLVYQGKNAIAAAIIFQINTKIYQVIYWGDNPEYSRLKPMNFLSYNIFKYYNRLKIKIIDIGPSTENSIPNYGLCEFKESIGCDISTKITMVYKQY